MTKPVLAALSDPVSPEKEEEFNTWYNEVHLKEMSEIPGIAGIRRYRLADGPGAESATHRYLALYEVDGDPAAVFSELGARRGRMTMSDAFDAAGARLDLWVPVEGGSA
ncbi:hypothetical protein CJD44_00990 [Streptomyces sp. alain-838]|nr:DUF4286 family protein [Streptomyces sp. alain-838]PAK28048.1 hypothetical protein CJD44_00990 [Streptomyces sp. alain-838]